MGALQQRAFTQPVDFQHPVSNSKGNEVWGNFTIPLPSLLPPFHTPFPPSFPALPFTHPPPPSLLLIHLLSVESSAKQVLGVTEEHRVFA